MLTTCITSIHDQFIDSRNKCHISEERKEKRLAARSYTNLSATRILWDAKIFQYQLHDIRAFCHAFIDFQLWSRGVGRVAVKVTSVPRPKNFDLCRLAARSYTNLSATRILWDAKIFQYQLHDIQAFCHAFMDFQQWSLWGGWLLRLPLYQDQRTLIYAD